LADFVFSREIQNEILPLGFTFSFPCEQEGLAKAKLAKWTKGFSCTGVEGEDVVRLLQDAITRRGDVKIEVCAILNDTTGCLMSSAWRDDRCRIGLILGTGTNACYLEEVKDIHTINQDEFTGQQHMVVNTEWGAFGDNGELDFILTKWDRNVDDLSINPGKQIYEKMISGMYMGELIRQVLVDLMKDDLIFFGCNREKLLERGQLRTDL
jgi:hexokinase